jgi:peptidoglycan/LPS O-acetylase OafA/YrhL
MKKNYYYLVDLLRWVAAIGVLLHHYSAHFNVHEINDSYFFNYFIKNSIIGSYGVWLFWSISGFVFANVYINNKITIKEFSIKRFARLYPLHFVTFIIIFMLQYYSLKKFSHFQIYQNNNVFTFIKNLFFINNGSNFNGPIWSVALEIPVYFFFFFFVKFSKKNIFVKTIFFLCFLFFNLQFHFIYGFVQCLFYFFLGVTTYLVCDLMRSKNYYLLLISIMGIFILPFLKILIFKINNSTSFYINFISISLFFSLLTFTFCIEKYFHRLIKKIKFLGDSSYAIYLIHAPIQVLILILNDLKIIELKLFTSYKGLIFFFIIINIVAYLVFKLFELPMRKKITFFFHNKIKYK